MRCRVSAIDQPQQGSMVHNWWSLELANQNEAVRDSIGIWQESHGLIVHFQRPDSIAKCDQSSCSSQDQQASLLADGDTESCSSLESKSSAQADSSTDSCSDVKVAHDAVASIEAAMTPVPQGAVLWHGTLHKNWAYKPHQWLATSMTVAGDVLQSAICSCHCLALSLLAAHAAIKLRHDEVSSTTTDNKFWLNYCEAQMPSNHSPFVGCFRCTPRKEIQ